MIGPVRQVNLNFDQSGRSKGTASVVFARKNDAVRSVDKLRNITLDGRCNYLIILIILLLEIKLILMFFFYLI